LSVLRRERRRREERTKSFQGRLADGTRFTGSLNFVYLHLAVFGLWTLVNVGWIPGLPRFDPTFVLLATVASVEAIFLSTFVLISQNRMAALADRRADLDLQVSLLAVHEITRTLQLVTEIARRLELETAHGLQVTLRQRSATPRRRCRGGRRRSLR
jgi:uncharacterized membrane protein